MKKDSWHVKMYVKRYKEYPDTTCEYRNGWFGIIFENIFIVFFIILVIVSCISIPYSIYLFIRDGLIVFSNEYKSFMSLHFLGIVDIIAGLIVLISYLLIKFFNYIKSKFCSPIKWE